MIGEKSCVFWQELTEKQLFFFKPYDGSNATFALTEEQARKATFQARNYYFRVAPSPPEEDK